MRDDIPAPRLSPRAFLITTAFLFAASIARVTIADEPTDPKTPRTIFSPRDTIRGVVVDEQGNPVSGITVSEAMAWAQETDIPAQTDDHGQFRLGAMPGRWRHAQLIARSSDGTQQAWLSIHEQHALPRRLELTLKPARNARVHVVDAAGEPVAGATVEIIAFYATAALGQTDATGHVELSIPADAPVDWVIAHKADTGFDYYENYQAYPTTDRGPLPAEIKLVLDGAHPAVEVQTFEPNDKPQPGVSVAVWTIQRPGKLARANIGGAQSTRVTSDAAGRARFTWLPRDMVSGVSFLGMSHTHHAVDSMHIKADAGDEPLRVTFKPNGTIRGKVTFVDGTPAPQILLQAEGNGSPHYFRGFARSDEDGNYSFSVYADQAYTIQVVDDAWAARSHAGEQVTLGDAPHEVNFQLISGTLIQGTLTVGADRAPWSGETATLTQEPQFVRWATTDERGHYQFRVGPGEYKLILPTGPTPTTFNLKVADQTEIVHDGYAPRKARDVLQGIVRRANDGASASQALIIGESIKAPGHAGFHSATDDAGRFQTERWLDRMFVLARDVQENQAGCVIINEDDVSCEVPVAPAATITGRVVDETGKPVSIARVQCTISAPLPLLPDEDQKLPQLTPRQPAVYFFAATADDGTFTLPAILVGTQAALYVTWKDCDTAWKSFEIEAAQEYPAGDIVVKPRKK